MKKFLIPILTVLLLLAVDGFIVAFKQESYIYQNENKFQIPKFQAKSLSGKTITDDIFRGKLTVVCLWVTDDAANSQKLMSDIESLKTSTDFRLIGIVGDIKENGDKTRLEMAKNISQNLPKIPQIIPNDELAAILTKIRNAPTIFFADDKGVIIGQPIIGNEPVLVEKELLRLTSKNSDYGKMVKKAHANIFDKF